MTTRDRLAVTLDEPLALPHTLVEDATTALWMTALKLIAPRSTLISGSRRSLRRHRARLWTLPSKGPPGLTKSPGRRRNIILFLVVHMIGNQLVFLGPEALNAYGAAMANNPVTKAIEVYLLVGALAHAAVAFYFTWNKRKFILKRPLQNGKLLLTSVVVTTFIVLHVLTRGDRVFKAGEAVLLVDVVVGAQLREARAARPLLLGDLVVDVPHDRTHAERRPRPTLAHRAEPGARARRRPPTPHGAR